MKTAVVMQFDGRVPFELGVTAFIWYLEISVLSIGVLESSSITTPCMSL
jgi:hypothetical protein